MTREFFAMVSKKSGYVAGEATSQDPNYSAQQTALGRFGPAHVPSHSEAIYITRSTQFYSNLSRTSPSWLQNFSIVGWAAGVGSRTGRLALSHCV